MPNNLKTSLITIWTITAQIRLLPGPGRCLDLIVPPDPIAAQIDVVRTIAIWTITAWTITVQTRLKKGSI